MISIPVRSYPAMSAAMDRYRRLGGNQGGIMPGMLVSVARVGGEPFLNAATAAMPQYHRLAMDDPHMKMQYHLAGYGQTNEEAVTRLTGESVERYAAIMAMKLFEPHVEYATYRSLSSRHSCMPLDLLGVFSPAEQSRLAGMMHRYSDSLPADDDVIAWISCPSLVHPEKNVYVPAQLMFLGFRTNEAAGDKMFTPSFSTGTAAHVSLERALLNAVIEAVQIDAFILNWYTDCPAPSIRLDAEAWQLLRRSGLDPDGPYEVSATYVTRPELPLPNIEVTLIRKDGKLPYIACGVQGDPDPRVALLRGSAEATAILGIGSFSTIFDLPRVHFAQNGSSFTDLDTNVLYFASPQDGEPKRRAVQSRIAGSISMSDIPRLAASDTESLHRLLAAVAELSEWSVYLDITPPELVDTPWSVVRVLIPELLSMCLPGFPASAHPRIASYGGVTNVAPHPLP